MALMNDAQLYAINAIVLAIISVVFAVGIYRRPEEDRRKYLPIVVVSLASCISYLMMSKGILLFRQPGDTPPINLARMIGYWIAWPTMAGYIGWVGGLNRRNIVVLSTVMFMVPTGIALRWAPISALTALGPLFVIGGVVGMWYLLLRPYNRRSLEQTGDRRLLYAKLRNLLLLVWFLVFLGVMSVDSALGFMDRFASVFIANYNDLLAVLVFGSIVLRSEDAVSQLGGDETSETTDEQADQSDSSLAEAVD